MRLFSLPTRLYAATSTRLFSFYSSSPLISLPPLTHTLINSVVPTLTPHDLVMDCTAGNGSDSAFLAAQIATTHAANERPRLLCVDVQAKAVEKTRKRVEGFGEDVTVEQRSHYPLSPIAGYDLALAVWNLGYLPNDKYEYKPGEETGERVTTEESVSIPSIVQGLECVRVNGVCLVTSYPASNLKEHEKVLELGERVGRMTNREGEGGGQDGDVESRLEGKGFRVFRTKGVGRDDSPQLTSFTRIK